jgi:hypothetical protein
MNFMNWILTAKVAKDAEERRLPKKNAGCAVQCSFFRPRHVRAIGAETKKPRQATGLFWCNKLIKPRR